MTKQDAIEKIEKSLAGGAQLITPKGKTYEEHLEEACRKLFANLIEPCKVSITSACFPEYDFSKYQNSVVWGIAKSENHWLLTLDKEAEFALGFGEEASNIMMLGFSSPDALGEWCG
ncbi:hypothetical protein [Microbulbifer elongatus]|uniref:hypothetical protein n=1 Tax=Microbulbifer elongatus TaxID=86173 RepID=UPI001CFC8B30|nr:hypothetical protein [Microbulbifer elongatus]